MKIKKLQDGGQAPAQQGGAQPQGDQGQGGGQNPLEQLAKMAQDAVQSKNCDEAMQVCAGFLQLVAQSQQAQGGQGGQAQGGQPTPMQKKGGMIKIKRKGKVDKKE